jgi:hypothetical protein
MIHGSKSLKDKRRVLKSIKDRASRFNASIAEVDDNEMWQTATLGIAFVSNDAVHVNAMMDKFMESIFNNVETEVIGSKMEIVHL